MSSVGWLGVQVQCFGLGMVRLDIRQESTRHADVLDTITTYLGLGSYKCAPILATCPVLGMHLMLACICHQITSKQDPLMTTPCTLMLDAERKSYMYLIHLGASYWEWNLAPYHAHWCLIQE